MTQRARLLSARQMAAIEAAAMAGGLVTGRRLMARAAEAVVAVIERQARGVPASAVVVCGPGNNGGDGYAVAWRLAVRGWAVRVLATAPPTTPDAQAEAQLWQPWGPVAPFPGDGPAITADVAVDALFGIGLSRPLAPALRAAWAGRIRAGWTVAVDIPSGLCADTGDDRGVVAPADITVTFHAPKRGHYLHQGPDWCGRLVVADIGLADHDGAADGAGRAVYLAKPDAARLIKRGAGHKYDHGHALVLGGGVGRGGAARLAARAALRAGAGLVTVGVPGAALIENAAQLDAIMLRRIDDAVALQAALQDRRLNAVVIGPGAGPSPRTAEMVLAALAPCPGPRGIVIDADGLTAFADAPARLWAALDSAAAVLTPHDGEFARLFPDLAAHPGGRIEAATRAAQRSGAVVLLKGRDTIIATPQGAVRACAAAYDAAAPWLATAGAGDVLAGLIGGLLARGLAPVDAAEAAALLHAACARRFGPGLTADDLPDMVPSVLRNPDA